MERLVVSALFDACDTLGAIFVETSFREIGAINAVPVGFKQLF